MILPGKKSGALISRVLLCSVSMAPRWRQAGKSNLDYEADKAETVVVLTSSDDEEANEDLSLAIVEKAKRSKANRSFEAALVNISSDDAEAGKEEDGIGGEESRKKKEIIVAAETETEGGKAKRGFKIKAWHVFEIERLHSPSKLSLRAPSQRRGDRCRREEEQFVAIAPAVPNVQPRTIAQGSMVTYWCSNKGSHGKTVGFIHQAGGECTYEAPFADELHSHFRFNHRDLLACANAGTPQSNVI